MAACPPGPPGRLIKETLAGDELSLDAVPVSALSQLRVTARLFAGVPDRPQITLSPLADGQHAGFGERATAVVSCYAGPAEGDDQGTTRVSRV